VSGLDEYCFERIFKILLIITFVTVLYINLNFKILQAIHCYIIKPNYSGFYGRDLTATPVTQEKTNQDSFSMSPEPIVEPIEHLDDFLGNYLFY
jgi:hypothetical protein